MGAWVSDFGEEDQALDIGCGGGAALKRMSEKIPKGHLTGVDYSPVSVELSRETNAQDIQNGKMEVLEGLCGNICLLKRAVLIKSLRWRAFISGPIRRKI